MIFQSVGIFLASGAGLAAYYLYEKARLEKESANKQVESYGKPKVGGPFCLVDHHGVPVTDKDFLGKYMLIYFGYTFWFDLVNAVLIYAPRSWRRWPRLLINVHPTHKGNAKGFGTDIITPIFISCDPKRDSVESIKLYVRGKQTL
jgi:protein SCO1